jgi:hypothetical protein
MGGCTRVAVDRGKPWPGGAPPARYACCAALRACSADEALPRAPLLRLSLSASARVPPCCCADTASLDQFKNFFLEKKLAKGTNVVLMYRTGEGG